MADKNVYSMNKNFEDFYSVFSGDIQEVGDPTSGSKSSGVIKIQELDTSYGKIRFIDEVKAASLKNASIQV